MVLVLVVVVVVVVVVVAVVTVAFVVFVVVISRVRTIAQRKFYHHACLSLCPFAFPHETIWHSLDVLREIL